jgi:hypothetical protein
MLQPLKVNLLRSFLEAIRSKGNDKSLHEEYPLFRVQGVIQSFLQDQRNKTAEMYELYHTVFEEPLTGAIGAHYGYV